MTSHNERNTLLLLAYMQLSSPAFLHNDPIPPRHTCDGDNTSPPLNIHGVPGDTRSLVLLVEDPDAPKGTFMHWMLWNIPPDTRSIPEGEHPKHAVSGRNDAGFEGYHGPCPPSGTHRYIFTLYALSRHLDLPSGSTKEELSEAMRGSVLEDAEIVGVYERVL